MLQLSKATDYAFLFLTNLAVRPGKSWNVRQAAEKLKISRRFLANIVHQLARRDIVSTAKGSGGGVRLRRNADGITVKEVIEAFEGPLVFVHCQSDSCEKSNGCTVHSYWDSLRLKMMESFSKTTINDLGGF